MRRILAKLTPLWGVIFFAAAAWMLARVLQNYDYHDITTRLEELPRSNVLLAMALTALSYAVLTGYDFLGLEYIQKPLPYRRIALASFTGYVFSYNLGLSVFGGGAVRFRLYSAWGLSSLEIARIIGFAAATFWLGCLALAGVSFVAEPFAIAPAFRTVFSTAQPLGFVLLALVSLYLLWCIRQKSPLRLGSWELPAPAPRLAVAQIVLSAVDCGLSAGVLYALLPPSMPLSFFPFLGIYLFAVVIGMVSHVPGGLGVFETVLLLQMAPATPAPYILGSLVAYRAIYYFLPFVLGATLLAGYEITRRRTPLTRTLTLVYQWIPEVVPRFLSLTIFMGGVILLVSGATPPIEGRVAWLNDFLPLPIMEASHFFGSLAGVGLLLLARGLQRRLDVAYLLTLAVLATGIVASLGKAFDYEEAATLSIMFLILLPCRQYFYRKASLVSERFTPGWLVACGIVIAGSVWLGIFSFRHDEYSHHVWWRFAFDSDAPRMLRASVGATGTLMALAVANLLRPGTRKLTPPDTTQLERAAAIVQRAPLTTPQLALLGDKELLFNDANSAFLMYGVEGRSWVAMGDPVGPREELPELVWNFYDLVDEYGGWLVFYQVGSNLPLYLDLGLTLLKLGEEARVQLPEFSLDGSARKELRYIQRRLDKEGYQIDMHEASAVPAMLPRLRAVSDEWLVRKNTREKGFSLGFYDEAYLTRCPLVTVTKGNELIAFANVWRGADNEELSVDLMRHSASAPSGVMDYLFIAMMLWGRDNGYQWFNLGMAPFAGLEDRTSVSFWQRMGAILFRHGEHFYNFQGLRSYKQKFNPVWESRYLALPGGLALPPVITNIAALVSRGLKGVVSK